MWTIRGAPSPNPAPPPQSPPPCTPEPTQPPATPEDLFSLAEARGATNDGYERFQLERQAALRDFQKRWGVPLGKSIRVQLSSHSLPLEGILRLDENSPPHPRYVRLIIADHRFHSGQIESLVRR